MWQQRKSISGLYIDQFMFSEPGRGKYIPDQYSALCKHKILQCLQSGNMNATNPEEVSKCLMSQGGITNARIQLGPIIRPKDDVKVPEVVKNIRKRHQFLFRDDKIIVRNLPGFGKGIDVRVPENFSISEIPKYDGHVLNKDDAFKSRLREFIQEGTIVDNRDVMKLDTETAEIRTTPVLDEEVMQDKSKVVLRCKRNPRCSLKFLSPLAHMRHNNGLSKCAIKLREGTQMDAHRLLYINKTGISEKYQQMTSKDARKMAFTSQWVPEIHDSILPNIVRTELPKGHALEDKKRGNVLTEDVKAYLTERFNRGLGPQNRKDDPEILAITMRSVPGDDGNPRFTRDQWLTKQQIQSYFCRLFAAQKKAEQGKGKKAAELSRGEIFDAERELRHQEEGHFRMELQHLAQSDISDQHPIQINEIDICELEHSISSSDKLIKSKLYDYGMNELKAIVAAIQKEFPGKRATMQKAAKIIATYIKDSHQEMDDRGESCPHYQPQLTITE